MIILAVIGIFFISVNLCHNARKRLNPSNIRPSSSPQTPPSPYSYYSSSVNPSTDSPYLFGSSNKKGYFRQNFLNSFRIINTTEDDIPQEFSFNSGSKINFDRLKKLEPFVHKFKVGPVLISEKNESEDDEDLTDEEPNRKMVNPSLPLSDKRLADYN